MDKVMKEKAVEEQGNSFMDWLKKNQNNFSYWFPKIENCGLKVPKSLVIEVPEEILHSCYMEREGDMERIEDFVKESVMPKLADMPFFLFMKNGCFSDKFNFKNCAVRKNRLEITQAFIDLNYDSLCMDTGGNLEIVFRERIGLNDHSEPEYEQYRIYNGMPLRPEFRVFYDFDVKKAYYVVNYWDWDYCYENISRDKTDKLVYETAYPEIAEFFENHKDEVLRMVEDHMKSVEGLSGIWSVDIMYAAGKYWLIDMAVGRNSAYYDPERIDKLTGMDWFTEPVAKEVSKGIFVPTAELEKQEYFGSKCRSMAVIFKKSAAIMDEVAEIEDVRAVYGVDNPERREELMKMKAKLDRDMASIFI